jgi:hypothetical protein
LVGDEGLKEWEGKGEKRVATGKSKRKIKL